MIHSNDCFCVWMGRLQAQKDLKLGSLCQTKPKAAEDPSLYGLHMNDFTPSALSSDHSASAL